MTGAEALTIALPEHETEFRVGEYTEYFPWYIIENYYLEKRLVDRHTAVCKHYKAHIDESGEEIYILRAGVAAGDSVVCLDCIIEAVGLMEAWDRKGEK